MKPKNKKSFLCFHKNDFRLLLCSCTLLKFKIYAFSTSVSKLFSTHLQSMAIVKEPLGLYDPIYYILKLGGSECDLYWRSWLAKLWENPSSVPSSDLPSSCFHFTLLHDDIMDEASLRRGQQTVHQKWDVNTAILSGDAYCDCLSTAQPV